MLRRSASNWKLLVAGVGNTSVGSQDDLTELVLVLVVVEEGGASGRRVEGSGLITSSLPGALLTNR